MAYRSHTLSNLGSAWNQFVLSKGSACWRKGCSGFSSVQFLSHFWLCDPMDCSTPELQSIANSWSLLKLMSIESVMPSNPLILCRPPLPAFNLHQSLTQWVSFSYHMAKVLELQLSISLSNEHSGLNLPRHSEISPQLYIWTVACQASLSMGFSRQEYWSGLPCPPLGDLPDPGNKPMSLTSHALAGRQVLYH